MRTKTIIYRTTVALLMLLCASHAAQGQGIAVSTNALAWANLGTVNAEAAVSVSRHFTLHAGAVANPWRITTQTGVSVSNRRYGGHVGARYWPWHVYSEWWIGADLRYRNFAQSGLLTKDLVTGDAVGAGLSGGYTFILSSHLNLDLGLGLWGGRCLKYRRYKDGVESADRLLEDSPRNFILPDNVTVSFVYVF